MKASAKITTLILMSIFSVAAWAGESITSISPSAGPIGGGQTVRLRGAFTTAATPVVMVGTNAATVTASSATVIDIVTPVGVAAANVNVVVNGDAAGQIAYTYVSRNTTLRVVVSASIAKRVVIRWGASTNNDDSATNSARAGTYLPYNWTVRDNSAPAGQIDLGTSYRSDDANNNKAIYIENASGGALGVDMSGIATSNAGNGITVAANTTAANTVSLAGNLANAATFSNLFTSQALGSIADGAEQPLVIRYDSPSSVANANYNTVNSYTVTLTAAAQ